MKYKGIINIYTSVVFDYKEANIYINNLLEELQDHYKSEK